MVLEVRVDTLSHDLSICYERRVNREDAFLVHFQQGRPIKPDCVMSYDYVGSSNHRHSFLNLAGGLAIVRTHRACRIIQDSYAVDGF